MATTSKHQVVIVGGGAAGISAAARLARKTSSIAVIEPSEFQAHAVPPGSRSMVAIRVNVRVERFVEQLSVVDKKYLAGNRGWGDGRNYRGDSTTRQRTVIAGS